MVVKILGCPIPFPIFILPKKDRIRLGWTRFSSHDHRPTDGSSAGVGLEQGVHLALAGFAQLVGQIEGDFTSFGLD